MNILFASAEVFPYAKAGGLGDVAGALPSALRRLGHDVRIVMPYYRILHIDHQNVAPLVDPFNVYIGDPRGHGQLFYTTMPDSTPVYLLNFPLMFDRAPLSENHNGMYGYTDDDIRFVVFCRGIMALAQHLRNVEDWNPDIIHTNDWHTALVPNYLRFNDAKGLPDTACVFTIHNLAYQGKTGLHILEQSELNFPVERTYGLASDTFNFMARGIIYADAISTVSPEYAYEITTSEYGKGLEDLLDTRMQQGMLYGILNGIDTDLFNPATDPQLTGDGYRPYSANELSGKAACKAALQAECGLEINPKLPLIAMVTRLVEQKGLEPLITALPAVLRLVQDAQIVILGTEEDRRYLATLGYIESRYQNHFHLFIGFFPRLAQHIYAGCDMIIVPSLFEPCGLIQMIAMRYGSVPIVRKTGGLADTVREGENGFVFGEPIKSEWVHSIAGLDEAEEDVQESVYKIYNIDHLLEAILRALTVYRDKPDEWKRIQLRGMDENHSWDIAAQPYETMYAEALARRGLSERK